MPCWIQVPIQGTLACYCLIINNMQFVQIDIDVMNENYLP